MNKQYKYFLLDHYEVVASFCTREEVWDVIHSLGLREDQYVYMEKGDSWYFPGDLNLSILSVNKIEKLNKIITEC